MEEIITLGEYVRIRRMDRLNWTVEIMRDVKDKDGNVEAKWMPGLGSGYGPYFTHPEAAGRWIVENVALMGGFKGDLKEHASAMEREVDKLTSAIKVVHQGRKGRK